MEAGNIPPKENVVLEHLDSYPPPFNLSKYDQFILVSPYQFKKIGTVSDEIYLPLDLEGKKINIDNIQLRKKSLAYFTQLMKTEVHEETALWIDPRYLTTEDFALIVANWNLSSKLTKSILCIVVPKGASFQKKDVGYTLWNVKNSSLNYVIDLTNPIWYPSLAREQVNLIESLKTLNPYDTYPLIDFPFFATQPGELLLSDHVNFLETARARTRNFIYFDTSHPTRSFMEFYGILNSLPKIEKPVFQAVITPGGNIRNTLISILAGVLSQCNFLTPKDEIFIKAYLDIEDVLFLRKIT